MKYIFVAFMSLLIHQSYQAQTIQSEIPDSIVAKFSCKKLYQIVDGARDKFKTIRGKRKPLKYTEAYEAKVLPKYVNRAQVTVDGRAIQYQAFLANTINRADAALQYRRFAAVIENCLEGWILETEPEEENQLYRMKAHEKEDMISGVSVELIFYKEKGKFIVELLIQP